MSYLSISKNKLGFEKQGKPFLYFADTIWSAFTNVTEQEWEYYLKKRKQQQFNTLQINILPQWDRCWVPCELFPFKSKDGSKFDFEEGMIAEYFEHAKNMCEKAVDKGFQLALVVLWSNFVPNTWASNMISDNIMPKKLIPEYCKMVSETFDKFNPIYIISGDTDLETKETIEYYEIALDELTKLSPNTLKTMHIKGRYTYLPQQLAEKLDFYMYQTGHNNQFPEKPYTMPKEFREKYPLKPLINSEPCYEQISYSGGQYGVYDTYDIRKVAWTSILSGANAGITYGAQGVWGWQKVGMPSNLAIGEGFEEAKPWEEALNFTGAWDYAYIVTFLKDRNITELKIDNRLLEKSEAIRMATTPNGKVSLIYAPYSKKIKLNEDCTYAKIQTIELSSRFIAQPEVNVKDGITTIEQCSFVKDILIVIER